MLGNRPTFPKNDTAPSHRNMKRSLCAFFSCLGPGVNSLIPTSNQFNNFRRKVEINGILTFIDRDIVRNRRHNRPSQFYVLTPLLAAPHDTPELPSSKRRKRRRPKRKTAEESNIYQRDAMKDHDLLTRDDEMELGGKVVRALELRDKMTAILEESGVMFGDETNPNRSWEDMDLTTTFERMTQDDSHLIVPDQEYKIDEQCIIQSDDIRISSTLVRNGSKLSYSSVVAVLNTISKQSLESKLGLSGGRKEALEILYEGVVARNKLMTSNIRLVASIAKKWMSRSAAASSGEGARSFNLYQGGWDRPSLDEVIQEGVLGLSRAVDKYDPERGLRFSTYCTYWITSYVRQSFYSASTGCLKVPGALHDIKSAYNRIEARYSYTSDPRPSEKEIADEIGVTVNRLQTALRVTRALKSMDEPLGGLSGGGLKGSAAGGDVSSNGSSLYDLLECDEIAPEESVEMSFLRQTLENAMAAELSPHERDVLRLRLGLDDGQTRTVKEVVEEYGGGLSPADVRSTEQRAVKKLSSPQALYTHNLFDYIDLST